MYVFANSSGQAVVVTGQVSRRIPFSFPALDSSLTAMVASVRVTPKPVVSVTSSLGGHNYLSVYGEDPMHVEINGVVLGQNCNAINAVDSAISNAVSFYQSNGIVNRATPVLIRLGSSQLRSINGFLVAITVQQDAENLDIASFSMLLLAESLDERELVVNDPPQLVPPADTSTQLRGVRDNLLASTTGPFTDQPWSSVLIDANGEIISRVTQTIQA